MSELEEARVLRTSRREEAKETIGTLSWLVTRYREFEENIRKGHHSVTLIRALRTAIHKAKESLEKYEESIVRVMVLEGLEDWDEEDEHAIESGEISDELDTLRYGVAGIMACIEDEDNKEEQAAAEAGNDVAGLAARFEDEDEEKFNEVYGELAENYEKAAAEAQEATFDRVYNELAEKAAEAQATFEIAKKYEADSNRFKDVSAKAGGNRFKDVRAKASGNMGPDNRYKAGGIRPRNRYKAGGIRPRNRYKAGGIRPSNRYRAGNMGIGNRYRYRVGNRRSGSRNKAASMEVEADHEMLIEMDAGKRGKELGSRRNKDVTVKATGKEQDSGHFTKQVE